MDKGHGGSSRLSTHMRHTGLDHNVFLSKSSKKEKLRRLNSIAMKKRETETQKSKDCTKDEEEVAEALFALAQTFNKTSELQPVENLHVEPPPKEADIITTHGINNSRKRCWVHVYICHFIKADVTSVNGIRISNKQALQ
ncbi:uncharacterized protein LOC111914269 [Lactuca sativa]|uniref:Uncharacterized protein n=1 Tax=Lactuca sativa TaxID=4236 RepID=A0A9R1WZK9_LACSA|nr:uncharacterized protein LOC111914269 [Lactuca sativa]XP_023765813.1 uncharacterized protein LOC111914269 [Lactuca sativa]KAJ0193611.1 hypothetical protein LSAT_V11C800401210 [Lactuca sativa]